MPRRGWAATEFQKSDKSSTDVTRPGVVAVQVFTHIIIYYYCSRCIYILYLCVCVQYMMILCIT